MGMAAGQARLLSITSRMSDNELRAQIINNQKMRLATESSQVSEAYVSALNQSQMMFTNYDADNNTSYQQLTFNSLTTYNPYNNQYGLVNASGQILVSERDASNFQNANGELETFLGYYGLEQTTTYFDNLKNEYSNLTLKDENGNTIWDPAANNYHIPVMATDAITGAVTYTDSGYTAEELRDMFMGYNGHSGYDAAISSSVYNGYLDYAEKFDTAYTDYASTIADQMLEQLKGLTATGTSGSHTESNKTLSDILSHFEGRADTDTLNDTDKAYLNALYNLIVGTSNSVKSISVAGRVDVGTYFDTLETTLNGLQNGNYTTTFGGTDGDFNKIDENTVVIDDSLRITRSGTPGLYSYTVALVEPATTTDAEGNPIRDGEDNYVYATNDDGSTTSDIACLDKNGGQVNYNGTKFDLSNIEEIFNQAIDADGDNTAPKPSITATTPMTMADIKTTVKDIINQLQTDIYGLWPIDDSTYAYKEDGNETDAHRDYREAAAQFLANLLGGEAETVTAASGNSGAETVKIKVGSQTYTVDLNLITNIATDQNALIDFINNGIAAKDASGGNTTLNPDTAALQDLIDAIVLNNVMNTYGEPKVTWIDTNNPNENGEAKYTWYSNLFERMQQGYKTLQDGLASSNEWIQFALESGIVTMEQVDSENNWNAMSYSNCSDITEQTNDKAVAIAEAEYNAAMNKIENKDKKYDLELKNIDTEHNSLETEYESIKSAIDKNIERTFKIYS